MSADRFALRPHIMIEHDEQTGEVILIDGQTGAMCASNETAASLLLRLQAGASLEALADGLVEGFDVTDVAARRDTVAFVNSLSAMGFVESPRGDTAPARPKATRRRAAA